MRRPASHFLRIVAVTLAGAWAPWAYAAGWYGGVAAGWGSIDITAADWNSDGTLADVSVGNSGPAYKFFAGYRFGRHLWLDVASVKLNDTSFQATATGSKPSLWRPGPVSGKTEATGVSVAPVFSWPFGKAAAVFVKGGLFFWDSKSQSGPALLTGGALTGDVREVNEDGVSLTYGGGLEVRAYKALRLRGEWEHFRVGINRTGDKAVTLMTLGVTLRF
ncbi:MAG TPA: hypothetical protein ENJ19_05965 [Gammaproteobacteria bacterium]|nr:hypothetical protein [Gammaproteobacteria bacterium]